MTTPRTRRSKPQQAVDILRNLLPTQDAKAEKLHLLWEDAIEEADKTRRALELLETGTVKDFQPPPPEMAEIAVEVKRIFEEPMEITELGETTVVTEFVPRPHRQRIGEKAQGISDVWKPGDGTVSVHSALMYARQESCKWCKMGMPFATEKRTEHYGVTRDVAGMERGFEYRPCTGIKE